MRAQLVTSAALLFVVLTHAAFGQDADRRYTLVLRAVPMHQALETLARATEIDLLYSSELVADRKVYCDGRGLVPEALLRCVLEDSGLDFVRSSTGTYVLIDALRQRPKKGDVAGRIVDGTTGEPLPYANVLLADASAGTVTNSAGLFSFSSVVSGRQRIVVTYLGYRSSVDTLMVNADARNIIEIALTPTTIAMEPIVVDGLTQRLPSQGLGRVTLTGEDRDVRGPFGTPDVAQSAAAVNGVSMRQPLADLHVQGGDAGEHVTTLDGVPVRDPVTLGRHLGAFSPLAIDRITVHKAGFGASQGSHLTGIVALEHDVSPQGRLSTAVDVDPVSVSGKIQGALRLDSQRRASAMVSLRQSMWDVYHDPGLESLLDRWNAVDPLLAGYWLREPVTTNSLAARRHHPELSFSDLHGAVRLNLNAFHTLDASVYRATNRIASELAAVNAEPTEPSDRLLLTLDDYDWTNWTGQVRDTWLIGARSAATFQLLAGHHASWYDYLSARTDVPAGTGSDELEVHAAALRGVLDRSVSSYEDNEIQELTARADLSRSLAPDRHVDIGVSATRIHSRFRLGNHFVAPFTNDADAWQASGYVEGRIGLGIRTTVEPGIRLTYLPNHRSVYAEPRLAVRYDGTSSRAGSYAIRLAGGLYRQFIPSFSLTSTGSTSVVPFIRFWLPIDESFAPPRAYHISTEAFVSPLSNLTLDVEAYYKGQPHILMLDYAALQRNHPSARPRPAPVVLEQSEFLTSSSGSTYGMSLRLQHTSRRVTSSLQYAYVHAVRRYPGRFDGGLQPVPWSDPHRLRGATRIGLTEHLSANVEGEASWGRRWHLRRSYYDYVALGDEPADYPPFSLNDPGARALPVYANVDVGLTYDVSLHPVRLRLRAAVINLLGRENVYDRSLQPDGDAFETVDRTLPGRRPVISIRLTY